MQAVIYRDYGDPSVLEVADVQPPEPTRNELRIQVMAAGVNPVDARLRSGELKGLLPGGFPRIPGYDVAGIVESADHTSSIKSSDRVMAFLDHFYGGAYAELATCGRDSIVPIPDSMSFEEAAAIPLAGSTALQSLRDDARLKSGQSVLVNGATGGVGAFAVQIARAYGTTVTAVASGKHRDFALSLGAADFIDYEREDFADQNRKWDVVFDAAGKSSYGESKDVLASGGTYVTTEPSLRGLFITLATIPMNKHGRIMLVRPRREDLDELLRLYTEGQLRVHVAGTFPLNTAADAHRAIEDGGFCGKLVLRVGVE